MLAAILSDVAEDKRRGVNMLFHSRWPLLSPISSRARVDATDTHQFFCDLFESVSYSREGVDLKCHGQDAGALQFVDFTRARS